MKIYRFKECNVVFAENQKEYLPLPSHKDNDGVVTACWKMSVLDRIKILFFGKVYIQLMTFNTPLQPHRLCLSINDCDINDKE